MKILNLIGNNGIYSSNVFFVLGNSNAVEDVNTLVDVGRDLSVIERIEKASTGVGKKRVEQVVLTHSHYDGNINVLSEWPQARLFNPMADNGKEYLKAVEEYISDIRHVDIVGVSAGFDNYEKDVGKKLKTMDFYLIGRLVKKLAKKVCRRRRFAILEGGYYLPDLGKNVAAFCQGFE